MAGRSGVEVGLKSPLSSPLPASSPAGGSGAGFFLGACFLLSFTLGFFFNSLLAAEFLEDLNFRILEEEEEEEEEDSWFSETECSSVISSDSTTFLVFFLSVDLGERLVVDLTGGRAPAGGDAVFGDGGVVGLCTSSQKAS